MGRLRPDPRRGRARAADRPRRRRLRGARLAGHLAAARGPPGAAGAARRGGPRQRRRARSPAAGLVRRDPGDDLGGCHGLGRRDPQRAGAPAPRPRQLLPVRGQPGRAPPQPDRGAGRDDRWPGGPRRARRDAGQPGVLPDRDGRAAERAAAVRDRSVGLVLRRPLARRARRDAVGAGRLRWPGRPRAGPAHQRGGRPAVGAAGGVRHRHLLPAAARQPVHLLRAPGAVRPRRRAAGPRRRHRPRCAGARAARPRARLRRRGAHRRRGAGPRRRAARDGAAAAGGRPDDDPPRRGGGPRCSGVPGSPPRSRRWRPSGCPASTSAASPARSSRWWRSGSCSPSRPPASWSWRVAGCGCRTRSGDGWPRRAPRWCCWPASCSPPARCGTSSTSPPPTPAPASSRASSCGRGCRWTAAAPTPSSRWGGRPGGPGRWPSRSPSSSSPSPRTGWPPCGSGGRGCRRGPAPTWSASRRCCSPGPVRASPRTTRGPTVACSSSCRS